MTLPLLRAAGRAKVATAEVRRAHIFAVVVLAIMGVLGTMIINTGFGDWWGFIGQWGLLICWVLLAGTLVTIYRRLKSDAARRPSNGSSWR